MNLGICFCRKTRNAVIVIFNTNFHGTAANLTIIVKDLFGTAGGVNSNGDFNAAIRTWQGTIFFDHEG